jgi:FkbM family methyltransferase
MVEFAKRLVALLPIRWQQEFKRRYYAYNIHRGRFNADEPEYQHLESFISEGDWVIDIGANIGHYTSKFSNLVGKNGRVFAVEPVPDTFEILAANVQLFPFKNVTLLNIAASEVPSIISIEIPYFKSGLKNYYMASLTNNKTGLDVFCIPIDSLPIYNSISIVKIDAEGHELQVLYGMKKLLLRDKPILIIETNSPHVFEFLKEIGYTKNKYSGSPNYLFKYSINESI